MATTVQASSTIRLEFELSTEDEILDTTEGRAPLQLKLGSGQLHPAIESLLIGLPVGASFEKRLDPSLAFGEVDPQLKIEMSRRKLPAHLQTLDVGATFEAPGPDGKLKLFRILSRQGELLTIDANHPLAGLELEFRGRVVEIVS
jgi:FKBP-type peptidyl-prolyl cis-trans isomerase 2